MRVGPPPGLTRALRHLEDLTGPSRRLDVTAVIVDDASQSSMSSEGPRVAVGVGESPAAGAEAPPLPDLRRPDPTGGMALRRLPAHELRGRLENDAAA